MRRWARMLFEPWFALALLMLLGVAARGRQYLARTSYWYDEASVLLNVFDHSFAELVGPLDHEQAAPPGFLWLLRACYVVGGSSELTMRLPALLASIAGLLLMVPLARNVVGAPGWIWAVSCACVSTSALHLTYQVKPYTTDFLVAEVILLATVVYLSPIVEDRSRLWSRLGLIVAAFVGPWFSFPSVFPLGGACLVLLIHSIRTRQRRDWAFWACFQALLLSSCVLVWYAAARYHNSPFQQSFWEADFLDRASVGAAVVWCGRKLVEAGNYGIQGTGWPMALLAAVGLVGYCRRQPMLAIVLAAPVALACVAAALRQYPLGNRLLFFLLPCLWLFAAQGVVMIARCGRRRAAWVITGLSALVLLPAGVRTARYAVLAKPSVEFRQAFQFVHQHWEEGDALWLSYPGVYQAYFGRQALFFDRFSPSDAITSAARRGRVWMVCHPPASQTTLWDEAQSSVESAGAVPIRRQAFVHLEVSLYSPRAASAVALEGPMK